MLHIPSVTDLVSWFSSYEVNNIRASAIASNVATPSGNTVSLVRVSYSQFINNAGGDTLRNLLIAGMANCQLKTKLSSTGLAIFFGDIYITRMPNVVNSNSEVEVKYVNNAGGIFKTGTASGILQADTSQVAVIRDVIATRIDWAGQAPPTANRNYASFSIEGWLLIFGSPT